MRHGIFKGLLIGAMVLSFSGFTFGQETPYQEDLRVARAALERLHAGYTRYISEAELNAQWDQFSASLNDETTPEAFYLELSKLLTRIRCDHTKAELSQALDQQQSEAPNFLPFRFKLFDQRMYVDRPGATDLARGAEILSIDGQPVAAMLDAITPYLPVDGFTEAARIPSFENTSEYLGNGFDHFAPLLFDTPAIGQFEVRHLTGETETLSLARLTYADFLAMSGQTRRYARNFSDENAVRVEQIHPQVAVLNVETFVNYRTPVDPASVYGPVFERLKASETEVLILDLRRNGGGSQDAQLGLLAHLIDQPVKPLKEIRVRTLDLEGLRQYIQTWDQQALYPSQDAFTPLEEGGYALKPDLSPALQPIAPAPSAWTGDLIVLTGPTNSSGATSLIAALKSIDRATLVGETTGGTQEGPTAGIIYFVELPHTEIRIRVPWQQSIQAIEDPEYGQGFSPDIYAPQTYTAWLEGRDPALDAALHYAQTEWVVSDN